MKLKIKVLTTLLCVALSLLAGCVSSVPPKSVPAKSVTPKQERQILSDTAKKATTPTGDVTRVQVQSTYRHFKDDTDQYVFLPRLFLPYDGIIIPGLDPDGKRDYYSLLRLETSVIHQHNAARRPVNGSGLGDTNLTHGVVFPQDWGYLALGYGMFLPTATEKSLGMGKWQAGPAALATYQGLQGWQFTAFAQQFFSFAGDVNRADQNFMSFQPIVVKVFPGGYFLIYDPIMRFDWKKGDYIVPINLGAGMAITKNLTFFVQPEYVVNGSIHDAFAIRLNVNFMPE